MLNSKDALIVTKVFSSSLKQLLMILSSRGNGIVKACNYVSKSFSNAVEKNGATPVDIDCFLNLLQKKILIPNYDTSEWTWSPVFFALSRGLQHNISIFIQNYCFKDDLDRWNKFLNNNTKLLDQWCKILNKLNSFEPSQMLNHNSHKRLRAAKRKQDAGEIELVPESPLDVTSNFVEIDSDEDFLTCDIEKDRTEIVIQNDDKLTTIREDMDPPLSKYNFCESNKSIILSLTETMNYSQEDICQMVELFLGCPNTEVEHLTSIFNLNSIPDNTLKVLLTQLFENNTVSLEFLRVILRHALTNRINELKEPVSRGLLSILVCCLQQKKRLIVVNVFCDIFRTSSFNVVHEDLIKKVLLDDKNHIDVICLFLENALTEDSDVQLNEHHLSLLDVLLQMHFELSKSCIHTMIMALAKHSLTFKKSLKMMKLVITIMTNYKTMMSSEKEYLERIVSQNTSFLKKKAFNLIKTL